MVGKILKLTDDFLIELESASCCVKQQPLWLLQKECQIPFLSNFSHRCKNLTVQFQGIYLWVILRDGMSSFEGDVSWGKGMIFCFRKNYISGRKRECLKNLLYEGNKGWRFFTLLSYKALGHDIEYLMIFNDGESLHREIHPDRKRSWSKLCVFYFFQTWV